MEVIPAIDLRGGQGVRLEQGDFGRETLYEPDPAAAASRFARAGASRLHVVDLDGARLGEPCNLPAVLEILAAARGVQVQVGGGIRSLGSVERLLEMGVRRVILGTAALADPELVRQASERFPECVILGLDARDGRVAIEGWQRTRGTPAEVLARFEGLPLAAVLHTDVSRDGTLSGPNVASTAALARATRHPVLASGGVSSLGDIEALARERVIAGVVVGRALYSGALELGDALRAVGAC